MTTGETRHLSVVPSTPDVAYEVQLADFARGLAHLDADTSSERTARAAGRLIALHEFVSKRLTEYEQIVKEHGPIAWSATTWDTMNGTVRALEAIAAELQLPLPEVKQ